MLGKIPPRSGKLRPVQLKKTPRATPSQKMKISIDCNTSTTNILKSQHPKIYAFLSSLNLENYIENFINNGIDTEEKLHYLNNEHLKMIRIPYAHRLHILKKLKVEEKNPNKSIYNTDKYEELVCPAEEDDIVNTEEERRRTFTQAIIDFKKSHNIDDQSESNIQIKKKNDNGLSNVNKNEMGIGEDEIQESVFEPPVEIGEYIENLKDNSSGIQNGNVHINLMSSDSTARQFLPFNKKKTICYQCLHMLLQEHCIKKYNKPFCSLHCVDVFESKNVTECYSCHKKIEIIEGLSSKISTSLYFCSKKCQNGKEGNIKQKVDKNNKSPLSSDSEQQIDILDL